MHAPTPDRAEPSWHIEPSGPLRGDVRVAGSKNAVTKHMVAALMASSPSTITNAPAVGIHRGDGFGVSKKRLAHCP